MRARTVLKAIESLTFTCTDLQQLKNLTTQLKTMLDDLKTNLPESEGIVVLPEIKKKVQLQVKSSMSSLPLYKKRGRKRLNSSYRNWVGKKANALRNVSTY